MAVLLEMVRQLGRGGRFPRPVDSQNELLGLRLEGEVYETAIIVYVDAFEQASPILTEPTCSHGSLVRAATFIAFGYRQDTQ